MKENNRKYWHFNLGINFRLKKKVVIISLISSIIFALLFTWLYLLPLYVYRHEFNDPRSGAIAFAINAALGVETGYNKEFLEKLKKIEIPTKELDSLACVRRLDEKAREQCKFVNHKSTQTHYNGEYGRWPCLETDLMTLRECLQVEANRWLSDKEIQVITNREILDQYLHIFKIVEPILVRPCDYIPTEKDYAGMKDEEELRREFEYDRKSLQCDEKIEVQDREEIHLRLRGYGVAGKPGYYMRLTLRRRD